MGSEYEVDYVDVTDEQRQPTKLRRVKRIPVYSPINAGKARGLAVCELFDFHGDAVNSLADGTFEAVLTGRKYFPR